MKILSLDLATKTGFAISIDKKIVDSGTASFTLKNGESTGMRFLKFRKWLITKLSEYDGISLIVYEQPHHRGGPSTEVLVGLVAMTKEVVAEFEEQGRKIDFTPVHSASIKKAVTGYGKSKKQSIIGRISEYFPDLSLVDDNHADAMGIMIYAWSQYE